MVEHLSALILLSLPLAMPHKHVAVLVDDVWSGEAHVSVTVELNTKIPLCDCAIYIEKSGIVDSIFGNELKMKYLSNEKKSLKYPSLQL